MTNDANYDDNLLRAHLVAFFSYHKPERLGSDLNIGKLVRWCRKRGLQTLNDRLSAKYDDEIDMSRSMGSSKNIVLHYCKGLTPDYYKKLARNIRNRSQIKDLKLKKDVENFFKLYHRDIMCSTLYLWTDLLGRSQTTAVLRRLYNQTLREVTEMEGVFRSDTEESDSSIDISPPRRIPKSRTPNVNIRDRAKRRNQRFKEKFGVKSDKEGSVKSASFPLSHQNSSKSPRRESYARNLNAIGDSFRNFTPKKLRNQGFEDDTFDRREKESLGTRRFNFSRKTMVESTATRKTFNDSVTQGSSIGPNGSRRKGLVKQESHVRKALKKVVNVLRRQNSGFDIGLKRVDDIESEEPETIPIDQSSESANIARPPLHSALPKGLLTFEDRRKFILGESTGEEDEEDRNFSKVMLPFRSLRKPKELKTTGICDHFVRCVDATHENYNKCVTCGFKRNLHSGESVDDDSDTEEAVPCGKFNGTGNECQNCGFLKGKHQWFAFDVPPSLLAAKRRKDKT